MDNLSVKDAVGATKTILMDETTVDGSTGLVQRVKVVSGSADVSDSNPMPIDDAGGSITIDGTVAVSGVSGNVTVVDGGGSLTVDGNVGISGSVTVVDGGGSVTVDGSVSVTGTVAHDSPDSGNPVKIGGKASASLPTQVANGDRVDAYYDRNGRQVIYNETIGNANDAVVEGDNDGTLSAKLRGIQKVFGAIGDAAASGAASISAKLRWIATVLGAQNDAQAYGIADGTVIGKLKGIAGGIGALDVAASHGDSDGSLIAKFKAFLVTLGQSSDTANKDGSISAKLRHMAAAIGLLNGDPYNPETLGPNDATVQSLLRFLANRREAVVEMHQYRSSVILVPEWGTPALISTADDITEATQLTSPSALTHESWSEVPQYIWIPYDAAQRYLLMVVNNFNVSINVELAGVSWGTILEETMEYNAQPLQASATTIANGGQGIWSAYGGLGSVAALQVLPILDAPWNWLRLKITPAANPTAGNVQLTFQYRKE